MNILLCGANGFLGRHIRAALEQAGHHVISGVRQVKQTALPQLATEIGIDYARDTDPEVWEKRLRMLGNIDIVINAVGILNQTAHGKFSDIHQAAPIALFKAAQRCGIKGIVQISALGGSHQDANEAIDDPAATPYMQSKRAADAYLRQSSCAHLVLRPSLVVGIDGDSSRLFRLLASLPVIALPGGGQQQLQPVHIDDVCHAIVRWLGDDQRASKVLNAVGPIAMSYRDMLTAYRQAMGLPQAWYLKIPMPLMRLCAKLATCLPQKVLAPDTLRMLEQDNIADASDFAAQLSYQPKGRADWFLQLPPNLLAAEALSGWTTPLFRLALALVWLVTGLLSLGLYPVSASLALLSPIGLHGMAASAVLSLAAILDLGMGLATLLWPRRRLWLLQMALILGYSVIIGLYLPEFFLHPFGPVLKNIPILALLLSLYVHERK